MNKRIAQFLFDLADENERLEMRVNRATYDNTDLRMEIERQRKEIDQLKKQIRKLNTDKNTELNTKNTK